MRIKTYNGTTECDFEEFAEVEPKLREIREEFRAGKLDKDGVFMRVRPLFGTDRTHKEWAGVVGSLTDTPAMAAWAAWIDAQPKRVKLFYSPEVVSGTITQEKQNVP